jgi:hypothetical protein
LLLKKYLNESVIFSRYTEVPDIFIESTQRSAVPTILPKEESEVKKETPEARIEPTLSVPSKSIITL